jgi:hypothetical protein
VGLSILADKNETEAVIVNDSVLPACPLGVVFSIYDSEETHDENIVELVNEFMGWCRPRDVRYIGATEDTHKALRREWERFLKERPDRMAQALADENENSA